MAGRGRHQSFGCATPAWTGDGAKPDGSQVPAVALTDEADGSRYAEVFADRLDGLLLRGIGA